MSLVVDGWFHKKRRERLAVMKVMDSSWQGGSSTELSREVAACPTIEI